MNDFFYDVMVGQASFYNWLSVQFGSDIGGDIEIGVDVLDIVLVFEFFHQGEHFSCVFFV